MLGLALTLLVLQISCRLHYKENQKSIQILNQISMVLVQKMNRVILFLLLTTALSASEILTARSLAVTIYNNQFAMVKDVRSISFDQGNSDLYFTDVSSNIQTETVTFKALNDTENIKVYQQNYEANLINTDSLLKIYINQKLDIYAKVGSTSKKISGILLGYNSGYILQTPFGIEQYNNVEAITFPTLPAGFFTLPTLNWKVNSLNATVSDCQVAYRTTGFSWKSDYSLTLNDEETMADIGGWVTIDNNSGKKYENAKLKLIAGDVNTVTTPKPTPKMLMRGDMMLLGGAAPSFSEKSFSDYHMYTLSQPVTINDNSQKQIEFIPKVYNMAVRKYNLLTINSGGYEESKLKASNKIEFRNSKANKLGIPLPKGTVRVFKTDSADGSLEFIGEDSIDHTPKDENLTINTGNAFDITADKIVKNYQSTTNGYDADLNFTISNHKTIAAEIVIEFNTNQGSNLKITWVNKGLNIETVSASLLRIKKVFMPDEIFSLLWNEYYRY